MNIDVNLKLIERATDLAALARAIQRPWAALAPSGIDGTDRAELQVLADDTQHLASVAATHAESLAQALTELLDQPA